MSATSTFLSKKKAFTFTNKSFLFIIRTFMNEKTIFIYMNCLILVMKMEIPDMNEQFLFMTAAFLNRKESFIYVKRVLVNRNLSILFINEEFLCMNGSLFSCFVGIGLKKEVIIPLKVRRAESSGLFCLLHWFLFCAIEFIVFGICFYSATKLLFYTKV